MPSAEIRRGGDQRTILLVRWRHQEREQVAQGIDAGMRLRAFAPLMPVVACPCSALGCRRQPATIENGGTGLSSAPRCQAQQQVQELLQPMKRYR